MRLYVRHRSEYRFSEPQARLVQLLRLTPCNHAGQSIVGWRIDVDRDARLKPARDGYRNETTMLYLDGPLDGLVLEVSGEVLTEDHAGMVQGTAEPLPPAYFLQATPVTRSNAAIAAFGREHADRGGGDGRLGAAHRLNEAVHDLLSPIAPDPLGQHEAIGCFAAGEADAQGAAHVLIAAARAAGYPGRYIAGHRFRPDAVETHAAHGWAELFVEGYGWIGFDPSAGRCPDDRYVRVAIGLDHGQAAPISGLRTGGGHEALTIDVHVGPEPARQD